MWYRIVYYHLFTIELNLIKHWADAIRISYVSVTIV